VTARRRSGKGWPIAAIVGGAVVIGALWGETRRETLIAAGADTVTAAVESVMDEAEAGDTDARTRHAYTVHFRFVASGDTLAGRYACGCAEVEAMRYLDSIPVLASRVFPAVNRPAGVPVRSVWVSLGLSLLGVALVVAGTWSGVRRLRAAAHGPPPPGDTGDGLTPLTVPHRHRRR
jgi:hypothetical protein